MSKDFHEACVLVLVAFTNYKMQETENEAAGLLMTQALNHFSATAPQEMMDETIARMTAMLMGSDETKH